MPALEALCQHIFDPMIDGFGKERCRLTDGDCSKDLKRFLGSERPRDGD